MKKIKSMLLSAVALVAGGALFAQTSSMNYSSSGLFKTDVDNFNSVTRWNTVKPENMFGYLGYGLVDSTLETGFAHAFKDFYGSVYFTGVLPSFTTDASTTTAGGNKSTSSNLTGPNDSGYTVAALLGFGSMGFKAGISYNPTSIDNTDTDSDAGKSKDYTEEYTIRPSLYWGLNTTVNDRATRIYFGTTLDCNVNKTATQVAGSDTITKTDNSGYHWYLIGDYEWDGKKKGSVENTFGINANTEFDFVGADSDTKVYGDFNGTLGLTPRYVATINPTERLSLKARVSCPVDFSIYVGPEYSVTGNTKTYYAARNSGFKMDFTPAVSLGLQFAVKPSKVVFTTGASVDVPTFGWDFYNNKAQNVGTGEVTSTTSGVKFDFNSADGSLTWNSGFTCYIGKNVTLDCNWDIIDSLIGNLQTSFNNSATTANGMNVFFMNINNVIFTDITIQLSVKL